MQISLQLLINWDILVVNTLYAPFSNVDPITLAEGELRQKSFTALLSASRKEMPVE